MKKSYIKIKAFATNAILFLLTLLAVVIIHSCRKDTIQQKKSPSDVTLINNNINLSMLKNAYNKGINKNSLKVSDINQSVVNVIASLNVDWTSYVLTTYPDSTQVIEFSIPNDTALVVPGTLTTNDSIKYHTKTSAVFILRKDTINMSFFMKTVENCTQPGYNSVISNVFYNNEPSTFNGDIFYFTLSRAYINGYLWQNGSISKALSIGASSGTSQQQQTLSALPSQQQVLTRTISKSVVNETQLTNCVTDVYEVYNVTIDQQGNILSWQNQVATIYVTTCDIVDTGTGSNGGTSTISSGGGGVTGAAPLPKPCPGGSGAAVASVKGKLVIDVASGGSSGGSSGGPCAVVVSTPSTPIFGINNSNAEIADANFDSFLSYVKSLGLIVTDPFNTTLTVNGTKYTGQMTEIYNSAVQLVASYFSPDVTSGPFQTGMEYSMGTEIGSTTNSTLVSGVEITSNGIDFGNPSTVIGSSSVSYIHTTSGGSTVPTTITNNELADAIYVGDGRTAINPQQYINCFTDGKTASGYKMTIYVAQPAPGTNAEWSSIIPVPPLAGMVFTLPGGQVLNVGHTFICFEKDNTDGSSVKQVMGFYPGGNGVNSKGVIKDDSGHPFNESYSMSVSLAQLNAALAKVQSDSNAQYYIVSKAVGSEYNCTDAAISWFDTAGGVFPAVSRGYFVNSPGDFGYALMGVKGATTASGNAPKSHGPCPN